MNKKGIPLRRKDIQQELERICKDDNIDIPHTLRTNSMTIRLILNDIAWIKWILGIIAVATIAIICRLLATI